ncbi:MAG TPA: hypothetical protein VFR94_03770 [Nitrososphaeraceae archaeon]|nr:hypothetical protein [Nitrososphaeraceae archaeon]
MKFNPDGTEHAHIRKQQQQQPKQPSSLPSSSLPTITESASTGGVASSSLEWKIDHLIAEVQALRLELQKTRK